MKSEIFYGRKIPSERRDITLDYYLIKERVSGDKNKPFRYGVKVVQTTIGNGESAAEEKRISDIFYNEDDTVKFMALICKNTVMPVGLEDVVEDYIVDYAETTKA